jgi:preprotein translocase subunit SecE
VATTEAAVRTNPVQRFITFYNDVVNEMKKVTWPDWQQVRQLSIGVIVLALFIGGVIALMDVILQNVLVRWIPSLFGG